MEQGIAISMIYPIMKTIVRMGYSEEHFCRYASFDTKLLQDPEARITGSELERMTVAAAAFTQNDHFGLLQGQLMEFEDMGILGYMMLHSETVADALAAYRRYNVLLCSGFTIELEDRGEADVAIVISAEYPRRLSRHCVEDMATSLYRLMGRLCNRIIPLKEVRFSHEAPLDVEPYLAVFGLSPRFGCRQNELVIEKKALQEQVLYSDVKLLGMFRTLADEALRGLSQAETFSSQVLQWLRDALPAGLPTLQQTADRFAMSARTLQNRLKAENTSFYELSVVLRKELAIGYLRKSALSIGDVAFALHFSEPSSFQNAFKKWTGLTPGQYRTQWQNEQHG
ncbi:AraC family transcriptional regulator [Paenibacillus sp. NPDC058071]|uniref:AraC family transcriptional regulator n=1 Tax=Paenibacillus sp. NPDC058071 TaxID=3346326 RepID=UPI0036D96552